MANITFDIAYILLLHSPDFATMRALSLTSRIFQTVMKEHGGAILRSIAKKVFPRQAFNVLNIWRPGFVSNRVRECMRDYSVFSKWGWEDKSLSVDTDEIKLNEVKRMWDDYNIICACSAVIIAHVCLNPEYKNLYVNTSLAGIPDMRPTLESARKRNQTLNELLTELEDCLEKKRKVPGKRMLQAVVAKHETLQQPYTFPPLPIDGLYALIWILKDVIVDINDPRITGQFSSFDFSVILGLTEAEHTSLRFVVRYLARDDAVRIPFKFRLHDRVYMFLTNVCSYHVRLVEHQDEALPRNCLKLYWVTPEDSNTIGSSKGKRRLSVIRENVNGKSVAAFGEMLPENFGLLLDGYNWFWRGSSVGATW